MPGTAQPEERLKRLTTICLGLAGALPVYVGVALLAGDHTAPLSGESTLIPELMALAGLALVFIAPLFERFLRRRMPAGSHVDLWLAGYVTGVVVAFTLRTVTGLVGFAITHLTGDMVWCAALNVVAFLAMIADWPTQRRFDAWRSR